jgi:hypothetical protein
MATHRERALQYDASAAKALEVILWLASKSQDLDVYHLVKACFFADKYHLITYGRPVTGDTYRAAQHGPVGEVINGLLAGDMFYTLEALGNGGPLPFTLDKHWFFVRAERDPNLDKLSDSDIEALQHGLEEVQGKSIGELRKKTHADPAYRKANRGIMDYRDFIPDSDKAKRKKVAYLEEAAEGTVF